MQHAFCPSNHGLTQCRQESILSTQSIRHNLSRKLMRHHLVKSLQSCSETATGIYWNVAKKKFPIPDELLNLEESIETGVKDEIFFSFTFLLFTTTLPPVDSYSKANVHFSKPFSYLSQMFQKSQRKCQFRIVIFCKSPNFQIDFEVIFFFFKVVQWPVIPSLCGRL